MQGKRQNDLFVHGKDFALREFLILQERGILPLSEKIKILCVEKNLFSFYFFLKKKNVLHQTME